MPAESTYQRICKQECEWCATGWPFVQVIGRIGAGRVHRVGDGISTQYKSCTAPIKDDVIEWQAKEIAELRAAVTETHRVLVDSDFQCPNPLDDGECGEEGGCHFHGMFDTLAAAMKEEPNETHS